MADIFGAGRRRSYVRNDFSRNGGRGLQQEDSISQANGEN
jgi:hypothetical protein